MAPTPVPAAASKPALSQAALLDAASRFPAGALEALARLVQQQPMPLNLQSPFQVESSKHFPVLCSSDQIQSYRMQIASNTTTGCISNKEHMVHIGSAGMSFT